MKINNGFKFRMPQQPITLTNSLCYHVKISLVILITHFSLSSPADAVCSSPLPPPLADISKGFPSGIVTYKFIGAATEEHLQKVRDILNEWHTKTGVIGFVEDSNNANAFPIQVSENPPQPACFARYIPPSCIGVAKHETGHLIGLAHEQQRIDRDRFITLTVEDDICNDSSEGTRYLDTIWSGTNYGVYNKRSIEHYGPVIGKDNTWDFTSNDGSVVNLGSDSEIKDSDISAVREFYARFLGWDRFRSEGASLGSTKPLMPVLANDVSLIPNSKLAVARVDGVDLLFAFGANNAVYARSRGTRFSHWKLMWNSNSSSASPTLAYNRSFGTRVSHLDLSWRAGSSAFAASTMANNFIIARNTALGIQVQRSNDTTQLVTDNPSGNDTFLDQLTWESPVNWGAPNGLVSDLAISSLKTDQLAIIARTSDNKLWLQQVDNYKSPSGTWTQIGTKVDSQDINGRPAIVAYEGQLHVFYPVQFSATQSILFEQLCTSKACSNPTLVTTDILHQSSPAVTTSGSELHLIIQNKNKELVWRRLNTSNPFVPIGGILAASPTVSNTYRSANGSYNMYALLDDGNIWRKGFNVNFAGRLGNLPANDYDRDAKTDYVVIHNGDWQVKTTSGLPDAVFSFSESGDIYLPAADYDGDSVSDIMRVHKSSGLLYWKALKIDRNQVATGEPTLLSASNALSPVQFGADTDKLVPGDYDGDWITDVAVFRPTNGTWYVRLSSGASDKVVQFGASDDIPVPGDFDGDGITDIAVYRPSNLTWYVRPSRGGADLTTLFGIGNGKLIPADYDGDGRTDYAYYNPAKGEWNIKPSIPSLLPTVSSKVYSFGAAADIPVPGDYDGDGLTDLAVYRASEGKWYVRPSTGGADIVKTIGVTGDIVPWKTYQ